MKISFWILPFIAVVAACSSLTDVDAPDLVKPSDLDTPQGAVARYSGGLSEFANALQEQVAQTGLLTDEFSDAAGIVFVADKRTMSADNSPYPFDLLSRARLDVLRAAATLRRYAPEPASRIGEMYALAGFVEVMFAEDLCTPIPLASLEDGQPKSGALLSRDGLLQAALAHFDSARSYAGSTEAISNLERVGRARALLSLGDVTSASSAVADVPQSFAYLVEYSASMPKQQNKLYQRIAINRSLSVADREGINGLPFASGTDSRIEADTIAVSPLELPVIAFRNSKGLDSPIVLASGVEAALIRAEAQLDDGEIEAWVSTLNTLRGAAMDAAIPELSSDSTTAASSDLRVDVLFKERAFWLYGTGHRQGDLRRLIRRYERTADMVFPTGAYPYQGFLYGTDVTFFPRGENANPGYNGCEDLGA